jgi:hypothetical protein
MGLIDMFEHNKTEFSQTDGTLAAFATKTQKKLVNIKS